MHSFFTLVSPLHALIDNGYVFIRYRGGVLGLGYAICIRLLFTGYFLLVHFGTFSPI